MDKLEPKKNKQSGIIEILLSVFMFIGFAFTSKSVDIFTNPELSSIFYFGYYMLTPLLFLVGITKMFKKNIISTRKLSEPKNKKQNPLWLVIALVFVVIGVVFFFLGKVDCARYGANMFCGLGHMFVGGISATVGIFILFIYFIRKLTKDK